LTVNEETDFHASFFGALFGSVEMLEQKQGKITDNGVCASNAVPIKDPARSPIEEWAMPIGFVSR
jgi:hypothetical protein